MPDPLVSAIIPVYNGDSYVSEAIDSVLHQTYSPLELIVVDDGSTDRTREVLKPYVRNGDLEYFHQEHEGQPAAQNRGADASNGSYLAFLDADDLWENEKIERQMERIFEQKDVRVVFSNGWIVNEENRRVGRTANHPPENREELIRHLFYGKLLHLNPTLLSERDAFDEVGGFDESLDAREDHLFLMQMINRYSYEFIEKPLYRRRLHDQSKTETMMNTPGAFIDANETFIERATNLFPDLNENHARARLYYNAGVIAYRNGNRSECRKWTSQGIRKKPTVLGNYFLFILALLPIPPRMTLKVKRCVLGRKLNFQPETSDIDKNLPENNL